jgi:hypothetical protein
MGPSAATGVERLRSLEPVEIQVRIGVDKRRLNGGGDPLEEVAKPRSHVTAGVAL